jgi:hypothetical protein
MGSVAPPSTAPALLAATPVMTGAILCWSTTANAAVHEMVAVTGHRTTERMGAAIHHAMRQGVVERLTTAL